MSSIHNLLNTTSSSRSVYDYPAPRRALDEYTTLQQPQLERSETTRHDTHPRPSTSLDGSRVKMAVENLSHELRNGLRTIHDNSSSNQTELERLSKRVEGCATRSEVGKMSDEIEKMNQAMRDLPKILKTTLKPMLNSSKNTDIDITSIVNAVQSQIRTHLDPLTSSTTLCANILNKLLAQSQNSTSELEKISIQQQEQSKGTVQIFKVMIRSIEELNRNMSMTAGRVQHGFGVVNEQVLAIGRVGAPMVFEQNDAFGNHMELGEKLDKLESAHNMASKLTNTRLSKMEKALGKIGKMEQRVVLVEKACQTDPKKRDKCKKCAVQKVNNSVQTSTLWSSREIQTDLQILAPATSQASLSDTSISSSIYQKSPELFESGERELPCGQRQELIEPSSGQIARRKEKKKESSEMDMDRNNDCEGTSRVPATPSSNPRSSGPRIRKSVVPSSGPVSNPRKRRLIHSSDEEDEIE